MAVLEEVNDFLDSEIRFHDKQHFEMKLDIELSSPEKNLYEVETYFFIPKALNIGPRSYSKADFYNNTQRYIRFSTPKISLLKLVEPDIEASPFNRINKKIALILSGNKDAKVVNSVYNEFKLFGCMIKSEFKDCSSFFIKELNEVSTSAPAENYLILAKNLMTFIEDSKKLISKINSLRSGLSQSVMPLKIKETFCFFEEYFSLSTEEAFTYLLDAVKKTDYSGFAECEREMIEIISSQNKFRRDKKYFSLIKDERHNEVFVYRRSVLKKFISSALFLKVEVSESQALSQVLFGIAAGFAMLFAVIATIYAQSKFSLNSWPFVFIIVVSYIFKDRIKDWLKVLFSKSMVKWISDRQVEILDPLNDKKIGVLKEAFSFISNSSVPEDISKIRNVDNITSIDEDGKPERVFKHEKKVVIFPRKILKFHERRKDISDIMRFNIGGFTSHADDSLVKHRYLEPESKNIETAICPRVYHVNVIVKYICRSSGHEEKINYDRIRIILCKDGIVRIEEVKI
ncbi:MAG: hypothetical protein KKD35_05075 [Elusimicrobia bacterium]|nr:hypothetical protein [Elusimicrobiota bacterium]